jgi:hypothetical protein
MAITTAAGLWTCPGCYPTAQAQGPVRSLGQPQRVDHLYGERVVIGSARSRGKAPAGIMSARCPR